MKSSHSSWNERISNALDLGHFVAWNKGFDFVSKLEDIHRDLVAFAKTNPCEALEYFEVFIAGCLVKGNEVDDSGAELAMFLDALFQSWVRCCSASKMKAPEFLRKIAHWMKADDIGFCHDLEVSIIPALSSEYRSALRDTLEQRLQEQASDETPGPERSKLLSQHRHSLVTLKKLLISTNNTSALIEIGERYGFTPEDCLALATAFSSRKQAEQALEWVERGLKCHAGQNHHEYELVRLRRKLMIKTGKRSDAVKDAWEKFEQCPSIHYFKDVLECAAKADKIELANKAMLLFEKADLRHAIEAFHEIGKTDLLICRIDRTQNADLKKLFYSTAIDVAKSIAKQFPSQSARLYVSQALVILDARKAKAYHHAHDYLHEAKILMERAGERESWLNVNTG
ncbi:MAG: hypothetical protein HQM15_10515 [Deltaproteobacteria bacterium]|nr:hypothetical protein [Deltaproteobacteria bacterium]